MRKHCSDFIAAPAVPRKCANYCHLNLHVAASPLHLLSPLDPAVMRALYIVYALPITSSYVRMTQLSGNRSASVSPCSSVKLGKQSLALLSSPQRQCRLSVSLNITRASLIEPRKRTFAPIVSLYTPPTWKTSSGFSTTNTPNTHIGAITGLDGGIVIGFFNVLLVKYKAKTLCRFPAPFTMPRRVPRMLNLRHYSVV
ncbi:hypothetical protein NEUTE1DRAFT_40811 [Neurospora tetrasperma FGSC 2508]|uniref:Uncharacterized protein n=1 Tax=Neurospora tetrasperma (strain FGSC 2508 / ATCC MYA-4615 / P0657) TaxID=510951 RepID=F8MGB5_NEUT8|nr:uncharacterized protein NEUTE1DRAFT_40811 [Neurospora tetrasperma FGSC 2508]EGO58590.1 hypothetical protein NEUTE1DRAFT_40811 [Neurospora tetrasperma FGSC 2508]EGZ72662.1 hypothetical protein NEUTE2DRAFT_62326 [Neurospora tetrasperma FGSC 2509]